MFRAPLRLVDGVSLCVRWATLLQATARAGEERVGQSTPASADVGWCLTRSRRFIRSRTCIRPHSSLRALPQSLRAERATHTSIAWTPAFCTAQHQAERGFGGSEPLALASFIILPLTLVRACPARPRALRQTARAGGPASAPAPSGGAPEDERGGGSGMDCGGGCGQTFERF